jgi:hypothetical protein|tara:strand:- start:11256 stop:11762 length:507 start_codon:yes stop_codon:yes gene_type:complete
MIQKFYTICLILAISGCSLIPTKNVEIVSKPIEIEIIQPDLPRPVELTAPKWYVVSEARITNPCKKIEDKRPKACDLSERENPDWPEGYTYLDRFLDEMKEQNGGEVVFVATSVGDYKVMAEDMQELKRYIKQLGEVVIYYRNVTMPNGEKGVGVGVQTPENVAEIRG